MVVLLKTVDGPFDLHYRSRPNLGCKGAAGLLGQHRLDGLAYTQHVRVLLDRDR
jgi:hypothetical protein